MYQSIDFCDFCDAFARMGRKENFSYDGKRILFDYLEDYESDTGEKIELDVIALCCDYVECTLNEYNREYGTEFESIDEIAEFLADYTVVCGYNDTTIVFGVY